MSLKSTGDLSVWRLSGLATSSGPKLLHGLVSAGWFEFENLSTGSTTTLTGYGRSCNTPVNKVTLIALLRSYAAAAKASGRSLHTGDIVLGPSAKDPFSVAQLRGSFALVLDAAIDVGSAFRAKAVVFVSLLPVVAGLNPIAAAFYSLGTVIAPPGGASAGIEAYLLT